VSKPSRPRKTTRATGPRPVPTDSAAANTEASNTEASNTAALLTCAKDALEQFIDVNVDDDGALTFQHAGVPGAVSAVQLADGLVVLSLTCVVAWDLPGGSNGDRDGAGDLDLAARLALRAGEGLFGTLGAVRTERGYDVTLRYAFPAAGLEPAPLGTLLMLVISTASQLRAELLTS
jgi:hypothetical protein